MDAQDTAEALRLNGFPWCVDLAVGTGISQCPAVQNRSVCGRGGDMPSRVEEYEVLYTIGSGSYGKCQKIRRKIDGKVGDCTGRSEWSWRGCSLLLSPRYSEVCTVCI